jgi:site-specific DNA-methyltransferase (adenine-specific)
MPPPAKDDWRTPDVVLDAVRSIGGPIDLDPCASPQRKDHFARINLFPPVNGLQKVWWKENVRTIYVNPPFGDLALWAEACADHGAHNPNGLVVLLAPSRTDTRYFHRWITRADAILFWKGRITFRGAASVAPFPILLAIWGKIDMGRRRKLSGLGWLTT